MEPNVQNFLKNFTEPKGTSVSANSNPANVNTLNSQNSVPNQLINTQSDFANIWNTWSPYVATSPGASKESSLLTGNVSGTGTNEKNTKANDEIQRTVEDLLDLNFDEITDMALSAAPILKEISPVETVNLAVGTPVEISDLFKGAANVFKDATHVQKDNVNAPKSITNVSYGNTSASQDIVCAIKDTMNVPKSIHNSSSDKASSIKDISCAKKDSVNAPNLKNALKDILNVHRDIQAKNNEASCEKNPEIQIKSLPKQGFENQIKSLPKQGFENQIKSLPKQGFENQIKSLPKKENKSPAKTLSNNIASVSDSCDMDRKLKCQLEEKKFTAEYQEFQKIRQALPIYHKKDTIVDLIERSKVVVISGPTGCGKTTQVPQYILDSEIFKGRGSNCRIVCTQPRRISAVSVAQRIAEERCEEVGNEECSVGYQVRLEKQVPRVYGSILLCTPGILLQNMHKDPELQGISHLLMDEIHERDITSDLFMAVMKELTIKRNIKVVLMSATMNSHLFSKYFGDCPMLDIPGSMYPVKVHFLEDILTVIKPNSQIVQTPKPTGRRGPTLGRSNNQYNNKKTEYAIMMKQYVERLTRSKEYPNNVIQQLMDFKVEFLSIENIFALIKHICFERKIPGAILVFLPGWDNITSLDNMMDESGLFRDDEFLIITLHSTTPIQRQQMAFTTPPEGVRKIVLATNIAETSITIDDIVFVIDCGLSKVKRFDARKNITTLDTEFISKANLLQRRGRAGRLREGECYHFISKIRDQRLKLEPDPEIRRSRIEDVIIKCKLLPLGKTQDFLEKLLNPPPADNIKASIDTLVEAQVLDANEELTPLGRLVALLPVDHFLAKMIILGTFFRCLDPILSIASSLSLKDPFVLQTKKRKQLLDDKKTELDRKRYSDHILISEVMQLWDEAVANNCSETVCRDNFLSETTFEFLSAVKQQLADCLYEMKFIPGSNMLNYLDENLNVNSQNIAVLRAVICAALYPNVVNVKDEMVTMNNQKVPVLETFEDKQVYLGFRSVNCKVQVFPSKFLVYFAKQSSSNKVYIHDSTMVTLSSLVLFANRVQQSFPPYVIIKNIPYDMSRNRDILTLRDNFHKAFRDFTENPRLIPFDSNEEHNIVVSQIVKLLTKEEENMKRM